MIHLLPPDGLDDGTVRVRRWQADDLDALVAACQDPEIPRWTRVPSPYTHAIGREFLSRASDPDQTGTDASVAVVDAAGGTLLGASGIHRVGAPWPGEDSDLLPDEIGYWLAAEARGRGAATRAVRLVCDWAFTVLGRPTVWLQAKVGNDASVRVAERTGFTYVETRSEIECGSTVGDLLVFRRDAP